MEGIFNTISGLKGEVPVAAVVSVGRKSERGQPVERDRFYVMTPDAETKDFPKRGGGTYKALQRALHPRFRAWNDKAKEGAPETAVLLGNLVFPTQEQSYLYHLRAQQLAKARSRIGTATPPGGGTWETPPRGRPACTGDGVRAQRFMGVDQDGELVYSDIPCPNDLCPFRQGDEKACSSFGRLWFMLRWPENSALPRVLAKWQTYSWNSVRSCLGLFETTLGLMRDLGIENPSLVGLPFVMTLTSKSQPDKGRTFPVVRFSIDGDLVDFLGWQRRALEAAGGHRKLIGGGTSPAEHLPGTVDLDSDSIRPGAGIPAAVDQPATVASPSEPPDDESIVEAEFVEHDDGFHELKMTPAGASPEREPGSDDHLGDAPPPDYKIDPRDPRTVGERLLEVAEGMGLAGIDLHNASKKVAGCDPRRLTPMFEGLVYQELERIAAERGEG